EDTFHVTEEEQEEALTFQWWAAPVLIAINAIPWALAAWLARGTSYPGWLALGVVCGVILLYYFAYEGFHFLMHKPSVPWIERAASSRSLTTPHGPPHLYMGKNYNFVRPLAVLCRGTLVPTDPPPPRVTEPAARVVARRHSDWGKRLREEAAGTATKPAPRPD